MCHIVRDFNLLTVTVMLSMIFDVANAWGIDSPRAAVPTGNRRAFVATTVTTIATIVSTKPYPGIAKSLECTDSVVQREINSFNCLIYNFKNTALDGGLDASTLNEPSIPFVEFGEAMRDGQVAFVEFMAPSGLVAYVTLKKDPKNPIRIGQGYPTGAKNSWSSPDFVIRSVSNYGVPYKFTVPALEKYRTA